jgi:protein-tyrosine-phosphatase
MNILFICRYNRFRSRVAEALFNHYNTNPLNVAKSAGFNVNQSGNGILDTAGEVLDEMNIEYAEKQGALQMTQEVIDWADKIVIVAEDVLTKYFPAKKVIKFDIPDAYSSKDETAKTIITIEKAVKEFIGSIEPNHAKL